MAPNLLTIPSELLLCITDYLPFEEGQYTLYSTCQRFRHILAQHLNPTCRELYAARRVQASQHPDNAPHLHLRKACRTCAALLPFYHFNLRRANQARTCVRCAAPQLVAQKMTVAWHFRGLLGVCAVCGQVVLAYSHFAPRPPWLFWHEGCANSQPAWEMLAALRARGVREADCPEFVLPKLLVQLDRLVADAVVTLEGLWVWGLAARKDATQLGILLRIASKGRFLDEDEEAAEAAAELVAVAEDALKHKNLIRLLETLEIADAPAAYSKMETFGVQGTGTRRNCCVVL